MLQKYQQLKTATCSLKSIITKYIEPREILAPNIKAATHDNLALVSD